MLDKDGIENGLFAPSDEMGDRERHLTSSLINLRELTIMITNQLGSIVDPENAIDVKAKKQKGVKDDMLSGQNVGDKSTLSNRSLPRHAAKPGKPMTFNKPKNYLTKSKDFTGDVISKNGERDNPDRSKPMPDEFEDDTEKFLGIVSTLADDERKSLDSEEVEMLGKLKEMVSTAQEAVSTAQDTIKLLEKKNRTQVASQAQVLTPQDMKAPTPTGKAPFRETGKQRPVL